MVAKLFFMLAALVSSCHCVINSTSKISTVGQELGQHVKGKELSMEVHNKIYSYTKNAKAFKNFTFEETVTFMNDLYSWEAPPDIRDNFVYSFWGYDFERRPVYYQEVGKQNFRRTVEEGTFPILERHFLQSFVHIVKSVQEADLPDDEIRNGIFIWDMEGFSMRQFSHLPTVAALVGMAKRYGDLPLDLVGNAYLINANYVTKLSYDVARPLLGNLLDRVDVFASNRNVWLPRLLKHIPIDIIPPWIGGYNHTKPLAVYG